MKRILLKLSGEALAGDKHHGFDEPTVTVVAKQVKQLVDAGVQVGIVIDRPYKSRSDRYACYGYELYLCVRNFPFRWNDDFRAYSV